MKAQITVLLAGFATLLFLPNPGQACSCAELTPCEAFGYASAVFVGRMIEGTDKVREYTKDGRTVSGEAGRVRFAVEEAFKGVDTTEITIFVLNLKGTSCEGTALGRGERYLVYAGYSESHGLSVGPCSPTRDIDAAKADLEFLRNLPKRGVGGRIYGTVTVELGDREPTPLAGITIIVEGGTHQKKTVKTDVDGNYELSGLEPGSYIVTPALPENYVPRNQYQRNREVTITDRGCSQAPFWISVNGRIGGKVTDSNGRAAPADLVLTSVELPDRRFLGDTDEYGEYEIDGVPPGRYVLQIDLRRDDGKEEPYFHPGTTDKSKATIIKLGMGQRLDGNEFQLPPTLQVKIAQGIVRYADGRPAVNVRVRLAPERTVKVGVYRANHFYTETMTDQLGRFALQGYKDIAYRVLVFDDIGKAIAEKRKSGRAELRNIILKHDVDDLQIVLPLESNSGGDEDSQKKKSASNN